MLDGRFKAMKVAMGVAASLLIASATPGGAAPKSASAACDFRAAAAALKREQPKEALRLLSACPASDSLSRRKGLAFHALYEPDSAIHHLKAAQQSGLTDDAVLIPLAEALLWKKDFRNAAPLLERVKDKSSNEYQKALARRHEILGEFDAALKIYDAVIPKEKLPWGSMERKALILGWQKRFDESIALFTRVIDSKVASAPQKIRCRIQRAEVIAWTKDFNRALKDLDETLKSDPKSIDARMLKGRVLEWTGDYKGARTVYAEAVQLDPENGPAKLRLEKVEWAK